jgi:thiosulfate dehydrogenase
MFMHAFGVFQRCPLVCIKIALLPVLAFPLLVSICFAEQRPSIELLKKRSVLDDYYSNVVFGYNIIKDTQRYASRYVGNKLNCTDCHRNAGTVSEQLPLNVAGVYPLWRSKNAQLTELSLKIRECFVFSQNGIMPPANAAEIVAIKTYIHYLLKNQLVGVSPVGCGVSLLAGTGKDPNPASGALVYQQFCVGCHAKDGAGNINNPAVWGMNSYSAGSGMNDIQNAAAFIKAKMTAQKKVI